MSVKHRTKFSDLSPIIVTAARWLNIFSCGSKQTNKANQHNNIMNFKKRRMASGFASLIFQIYLATVYSDRSSQIIRNARACLDMINLKTPTDFLANR
jgi:hypothetical protein